LAMEVLCEPALKIRGEANIEVAVAHGEKDVDAVLEFDGHP
jgi:hypothetical protein